MRLHHGSIVPQLHWLPLFDTHSHLDVELFDRDRNDVVARAVAAGVEAILVPAIRPATWPGLRDIAARYDIICLKNRVEGSVAFVPSVFGMTMASVAVKRLCGLALPKSCAEPRPPRVTQRATARPGRSVVTDQA